jgi:hypothetical protein
LSDNSNISTWPTHCLFGLTLASDYPFATRLALSAGAPDLTFTCIDQSPLPGGWEQTTPAYTSPYRNDDGESILHLYRLDACDVLHFTHVADFYLFPDRIVCHPSELAGDPMVETHLLVTVLAFWLERQGIPTLHASAVVVGGRAAAFLSHSRDGKSTLAAALVQAGYPLLTDDILPVEHTDGAFRGRPGYPTMRLWPDEAQHFLGSCQGLELVHPKLTKRRVPVGPDGFGAFCDTSQRLACLYLPERRDAAEWGAKIEVTPVSLRDAVIELVRHSFTARIVEALGWQPQRLDFFARLVRQVPLRRLVYPSGFAHLPRVREAILQDLESL